MLVSPISMLAGGAMKIAPVRPVARTSSRRTGAISASDPQRETALVEAATANYAVQILESVESRSAPMAGDVDATASRVRDQLAGISMNIANATNPDELKRFEL